MLLLKCESMIRDSIGSQLLPYETVALIHGLHVLRSLFVICLMKIINEISVRNVIVCDFKNIFGINHNLLLSFLIKYLFEYDLNY